MFTLTHDLCLKYIWRCIDLAKEAPFEIFPPLVGAVILSQTGELIGEGYKYIIPGTEFLVHAERAALDRANSRAQNGTLVTTLEPCVRVKNNRVFKPCAELIAERGIKRVIIGSLDPSHNSYSVRGKDYLESKGVEVVEFLTVGETINQKLYLEAKKSHIRRPLYPHLSIL